MASLLAFGDLLLNQGPHRVTDRGERTAQLPPLRAFVTLLQTNTALATERGTGGSTRAAEGASSPKRFGNILKSVQV